MNPPRTLRIAGSTWKVRIAKEPKGWVQKNTEEFYGECLIREQEICLHPDQAPETMGHTLFHEVLHAVLFQTPLADLPAGKEEQLVASLAPHIVAVLRDNPKLVEFLTT